MPAINHPYYGTSTPWGRIKVVTYNSSYYHLAMDGSYGNFSVLSGSGLPALSMGGSNTDSSPDYFSLNLAETNTWSVVGIRDNQADGADPWRLELYTAPDFTNMLHLSDPDDYYNLAVINNFQVPLNEYGVKFYSASGNTQARVNYAGDPTATLIMGGNPGLNWSSNYVVQMYNVWLTTGPKNFNLSFTGSADLDFALFKSGGDGIFTLQEAVAASRNQGAGVAESFLYGVTQAGWYGVLVMSRTSVNSTYSITIQAGASWSGAVSTSWTNTANWSGGLVPTNTTDVVIPAGRPFYPVISGSTANVRNLSIENGASVTIAAATLSVAMDLHVYGNVTLNNAASMLQVSGSALWKSGSTASAVTGSLIYCGRHWTFEQGSMVLFSAGTVIFSFSDNSRITINSDTARFHHLKVNKPVDKSASFNDTSTQDLWINGDLTIQAGTFYSNSSRTMLLYGALSNTANFQFDDGTIQFMGATANLNTPAGSYFHHIYLKTTQPIYMSSHLYLNGDLSIHVNSGVLHTQNYNIYIGGNWNNYKGVNGFVEGTGTVIFNGSQDQYCLGEVFYGLEVANPYSNLIFTGIIPVSSCVSYNWTAGSIEVEGGTLNIADLADNGLFGQFRVTGGTLNITQDNAQYTDLNGTILITSGTMRVSGGNGASYWPYAANAHLEMSGGVLEFTNRSILIFNSSTYALTTDITGGLIRTAGSFTCSRTDFIPEGGVIEMFGSTAATLYVNSSSVIRNLSINKGSARAEAMMSEADQRLILADPRAGIFSTPEELLRLNDVILTANLYVYGPMAIESGTLKLNGYTLWVEDEMQVSGTVQMTNEDDRLVVYGALYWNAGASTNINFGTIELHYHLYIAANSSFILTQENNLNFVSVGNSNIYNQSANCVFASMTVDKDNGSVNTQNSLPITIQYGLGILTNGILYANTQITTGYLSVGSAATLQLSGNMTVTGTITISGNATLNSCTLTGNDSFFLYGQMLMTNSTCTLNKPYLGVYQHIGGALTLNNSTFNVVHNGINFGTGSSFISTNGTLKTGWNLTANTLNGFRPAGGTVEMNGARNAMIQMHSSNYFHNLLIYKPSASYSVSTSTALVLNGNLSVSGGVFMPAASVSVYGAVIVYPGAGLNATGGSLSMLGAASVVLEIYGPVTIPTFTINKSGTGSVDMYADLVLSGSSQMNIISGEFRINDYSCSIGGTITVSGGGKLVLMEASVLDLGNLSSLVIGGISSSIRGSLVALGSAGGTALITSSTGFYSISFTSYGEMKASYCIFEKMNTSGILFGVLSYLNTEYPMSNCTFRNGQSGGSLITYTNNAVAGWTIPNANFSANIHGGTYNVSKPGSTGSLTFTNATGSFSGSAFENDPTNTIHWQTTAAPAVPQNLNISTTGSTVTLTWNASAGAVSYRIYRRETPYGAWGSHIGTTTATTWVDNAPPASGRAFYRVSALN
ncbi:MAG: hypothetical protein U1B83_08495 [Candidatus Cloacimonadaceae bacterium]|nr:hypothetical protein [Candidatus Cloacimonadaceae bacterium]